MHTGTVVPRQRALSVIVTVSSTCAYCWNNGFRSKGLLDNYFVAHIVKTDISACTLCYFGERIPSKVPFYHHKDNSQNSFLEAHL